MNTKRVTVSVSEVTLIAIRLIRRQQGFGEMSDGEIVCFLLSYGVAAWTTNHPHPKKP